MGINNAPALAAAAISRRSVSVAMNALHLRAPARPGKRRTEAADERHLRESVMTMNHSGGHAGHMPATGDRRALVISGWLTGLYFLVELGIGLWTGSVAVIERESTRLNSSHS